MRHTTYLVTVYILTLVAAVAALSGCAEHAKSNKATCLLDSETNLISCQDGNTFEVPQGPKGDAGGAGAQGQAGAEGQNGEAGPQGIPGPKGDAGENGSVVSFVKFCDGQEPSYPSTFPEYGLCVDGHVYAVYSTNGGFGVYLPPGNYTSNGINSACSFTVNADCAITH